MRINRQCGQATTAVVRATRHLPETFLSAFVDAGGRARAGWRQNDRAGRAVGDGPRREGPRVPLHQPPGGDAEVQPDLAGAALPDEQQRGGGGLQGQRHRGRVPVRQAGRPARDGRRRVRPDVLEQPGPGLDQVQLGRRHAVQEAGEVEPAAQAGDHREDDLLVGHPRLRVRPVPGLLGQHLHRRAGGDRRVPAEVLLVRRRLEVEAFQLGEVGAHRAGAAVLEDHRRDGAPAARRTSPGTRGCAPAARRPR